MRKGPGGSAAYKLFLAIGMLLSASPVLTFAAPGDLDTTFNPPAGFVTYNHSNEGNWDEKANAVAVQSGGKIVVAGTCFNSLDEDLFVLRYNRNGTLDSSFGVDGIAVYDSGGSDCAKSVAVQRDGKIVVAGHRRDVLILRYRTDGTLDPIFSDDGVFTYGSPYLDYASSVLVQPDQKIVAAGTYGQNGDILVLRCNPNGTLDTTFGAGGVVTYDGGRAEVGYSTAIQAGGKIAVSGESLGDVIVLRLIGGQQSLPGSVYLPLLFQPT